MVKIHDDGIMLIEEFGREAERGGDIVLIVMVNDVVLVRFGWQNMATAINLDCVDARYGKVKRLGMVRHYC